MLPEENRFVDLAIHLGYVDSQKASSAYTLSQYYARHGHRIDIVQIFMQKGYLNAAQVEHIMKEMGEDGERLQASFERNRVPTTKEEVPKEEVSSTPASFLPSYSLKAIAKGKTWRDFEIIDKIGRGGMAEVYKARQKAPKRTVALKFLLPHKVSEEMLARFLQEAQLSAKLEHPNIVKVFLAEIYNQIPFIAMAYIDGKPLNEYCGARKLSLEEFLQILNKIVLALSYSHQEGIIHRDIKPGNILVTPSGEPFLMDFGIARASNIEDASLTKSGEILGTPQYMSPEQARGERPLDHRTDIYSLGAILYEFLTDVSPVSGNSSVEMLFNLANTPVISPRHFNLFIPDEVESIILKAMAHKKENRYGSAKEMADDISRFLSIRVVLSPSPARSYPRKMLYRYKLHARKIWTALSLLFFLLLFFQARLIFHASSPIVVVKNETEMKRVWKMAQQCFQAREYGKSLDETEKVLLFKPDHLDALMLKIKILETERSWNDMRLAWEKVALFFPKRADCLAFIGEQALQHGYFEEASRYLEKAVELCPGEMRWKKWLAKTWGQTGDYSRAIQHYRECGENDPEVFVGMANLFHLQQNQDHADELITRAMKMPEFLASSSSLKSEAHFLKARIKWEICQKDLYRWQWLFPGRSEDKAIQQSIESFLDSVGQSLQQASQMGQGSQEIQGYLIGLGIERLKVRSEESERKFNFLFGQLPPHCKNDLFFQKIVIRFLIRQGKWQEAEDICNALLDQYPWFAELYYLRAIALFQLNKSDNAAEDIQNSVKLENSNFIPIETITFLLLEEFTQESYQIFSRIVHLYFQSYVSPVENFAFSSSFERMRDRYFTRNVHSKNRTEVSFDMLLKTALESPSVSARNLAIDAIVASGTLEEVEAKIQESAKKEEVVRQKRFQEIHLALEKRKDRERTLLIKQILLQYSILLDTRYPLKIIRMGKEAEEKLSAILLDSQEDPYLRLLAARMMLSLCRPHLYYSLAGIAAGKNFPCNLLAFAAIRERGIPQANPVVEDFKTIPSFYRVLYAWHMDPRGQENASIIQELLEDKDEMVSLYAAYNLHRHLKLDIGLKKKAAHRFLELMKNQNPEIRRVACRAFFSFKDIGMDVLEGWERDRLKQEFCRTIFCEYYEALIAIIKDPNVKVGLSGLISSLGDGLTKKSIPKDFRHPMMGKIEEAIRDRLKEPSYLIKFWSVGSIGLWNRGKDLMKIIKDPSIPFAIRIGSVFGLYQGKSLDSVFELLNFAGEEGKSQSDKVMKQLIIVMISHWGASPTSFKGFKPMISKRLSEWIQSKDENIQRAAVIGFLWCGNKSVIERLMPYRKSPSYGMKLSATITIATLIAEHTPHAMASFIEEIKRESPNLLEAVSCGYYNYLLNQIFVSYHHSPLKWYEVYLERLEKRGPQEWISYLDAAAQAFPAWRYFYESALLYFKSGNRAEVSRRLRLALDQVEKDAQKFQKQREYSPSRIWIAVQRSKCHFLYAKEAMHRKDFQEALQHLENANREMPLDRKIYLLWGRVYESLNNHEKAIECFAASYLCDTEESDPLFCIAVNLMAQGNQAGAISALQFAQKRFFIHKNELFGRYPLLHKLGDNEWIKTLPD